MSEKKKIDTRSMSKRLFSTLLLWGIVAGVFFSGRIEAIAVLVGILAILGGMEYVLLQRETPGRRRRIGAFIVAILYLVVLSVYLLKAYTMGSDQRFHLMNFTPEILGVVITVLLSFSSSLSKEIKGVDPIYAVATSILGFIYVPLLFGGFMTRLIFLSPEVEGVSGPVLSGAWLVLFVAIVTKFTDMGAYLSGTLFGSTKMIKHISPGKTWEGTLGSFVVAQGGAFGIWFLAGERLAWMGPWWSIAILAFLISVAAIIGDLAESILKRSMKIKDSGGFLPGIGGVLDLVDSICFSAPIAYFYLLFTAVL